MRCCSVLRRLSQIGAGCADSAGAYRRVTFQRAAKFASGRFHPVYGGRIAGIMGPLRWLTDIQYMKQAERGSAATPPRNHLYRRGGTAAVKLWAPRRAVRFRWRPAGFDGAPRRSALTGAPLPPPPTAGDPLWRCCLGRNRAGTAVIDSRAVRRRPTSRELPCRPRLVGLDGPGAADGSREPPPHRHRRSSRPCRLCSP